jgi:predicted  nucleic acid-binding Zn-ribbon protein
MQMMQQLREELYQVAQRKLNLEKEILSLNKFISSLKRELLQRTPATE